MQPLFAILRLIVDSSAVAIIYFSAHLMTTRDAALTGPEPTSVLHLRYFGHRPPGSEALTRFRGRGLAPAPRPAGGRGPSEGRFLVTITITDTEATPQSYSVSFIIDPIVRIS